MVVIPNCPNVFNRIQPPLSKTVTNLKNDRNIKLYYKFFIKIYKYIYLYKVPRIKFCKDINLNPLTFKPKWFKIRVSVIEIPANHLDNVYNAGRGK